MCVYLNILVSGWCVGTCFSEIKSCSHSILRTHWNFQNYPGQWEKMETNIWEDIFSSWNAGPLPDPSQCHPASCAYPVCTTSVDAIPREISLSDILLMSRTLPVRSLLSTPAEMRGKSCHLPVNQKFEFLLRKAILSIFCLLLVSQQAYPPLMSHWRARFLRHHCSCCSELRLQKIKGFPGLYWGEKGYLTCETGHTAAFNSHPLIGHCACQFFI